MVSHLLKGIYAVLVFIALRRIARTSIVVAKTGAKAVGSGAEAVGSGAVSLIRRLFGSK